MMQHNDADRVVNSVKNLIEQTQDIDPPSVHQTTKFTVTNLSFRTANNTIPQTPMRLRRRHPRGGT